MDVQPPSCAASLVAVRDVLPRDGFQDFGCQVPTVVKIAVIATLYEAGHRWVEVTSMVRPEWVPQFDDAETVLAACADLPGLRRSVFVPNRRGLERALLTGCEEVSLAVAATDDLSRANFGRDRDTMLHEVLKTADAAWAAGVPSSVTIGGAFGCPYEGPVDPDVVSDLAVAVAARGVDVVFLADTIGAASRRAVAAAFDVVVDRLPTTTFGVHLHGGRGAIECVEAAVVAGATVVDAASAGYGGCPFVPSAPGNVPAEVVVGWLAERKIPCGLDADAVARGAAEVRRLLEEVGTSARDER